MSIPTSNYGKSGVTGVTGVTSQLINNLGVTPEGVTGVTRCYGQAATSGEQAKAVTPVTPQEKPVLRELFNKNNAVTPVTPVTPKKHNKLNEAGKTGPIQTTWAEKQGADFPGVTGVTPKDPEAIEERAAILEFDAGLSRQAAEQIAAGVTFRLWELHFLEQEPRLIYCTPAASYAEVLADWPEAIAAEPFTERWPGLTDTKGGNHANH